MAIEKNDLISASDVSNYVSGKSAERWITKSIKWRGNPDPISDQSEKWFRNNDIDFPHSVGEASRGLWVSGTSDYAVGDTVIGLRRNDSSADGILWECTVDLASSRPGEIIVKESYWVDAEWKALNWNFRLVVDLIGRNNSHVDIVKQKYEGESWVDDYYIVSTNVGNDPHYIWANGWQDGPDYKIYLIPGRYKIYFRTIRVGLGQSNYYWEGKPWQIDMVEDEYIRTYKEDLSNFKYAEVTMQNARDGFLGSSITANGEPIGGI